MSLMMNIDFFQTYLENSCFLKKRIKSNENTTSFLSDLLPYNLDAKVKAQLRISLKEYSMLLSSLLGAINSLEVCEYENFDAIVGENACQIRAIWISIISLKLKMDLAFLKREVQRTKKEIDSLLEEKAIAKLMSNNTTCSDLFIERNLFISITDDIRFLLQCFLLREAKIKIDPKESDDIFFIKEKFDPKNLKKFGNVSTNFLTKLLSKMRKLTAIDSVQFVQGVAKKTKDKKLMKMLSDDFTIRHNNHLLCTPMFWTYKALLHAAQLEKIPLIIHVKFLYSEKTKIQVVDEEWLVFEPKQNSEGFQLNEDRTQINSNRSACIIQGIVDINANENFSKELWIQNFTKHSIVDIILAGAADHRQYPDEVHDESILSLNDLEYETFKSLALTQGFSSKNPSTFFIQHVYPAHAHSILSEAESYLAIPYAQ